MIKTNAKLTIRRIPLAYLQVIEVGLCYPEKFAIYLQLLLDHPDQDVDPLLVVPSLRYPGIFAIENGKHRFCSSIMAGRYDVLCIVKEEAR